MRLSELVKLKADLLRIQCEVNDYLNNSTELAHAENFINALSEIEFTFSKDISTFFQSLKKEQQSLMSNLYKQIRQIEEQIDQKSSNMLSKGYTINGAEACSVITPELERLNRISQVDPEIKNLVKAQIFLKTQPKFPCLEIGPGDGQWTEYLVAADPLYLLDIHKEFLDFTISKFPGAYQPRIRPYTLIEAEIKDHLLEKLPQAQFGFVFAWDVFTYFTPDYFEKYLNSAFQILKPGGSILFNYNNCEIYQNVKYAETGFQSWMPKYLLEKIVKQIGYDIEKHSNIGNVHWVIIRKPGSLTTIKATQALGRIVRF